MTWAQLSFQNSNSFIMEEFTFFHDFALMILITIITFVGFLLFNTCYNTFMNKYLLENQILEVVWTIIPTIVLVCLAIPSLTILYTLDEASSNSLSMKIVGNQWYWSYEYQTSNDNMANISFDSYMTSLENATPKNFRLLDVDNRLITPINTEIRLMVSSTDVLHSWSMPVLGLKIDACPGRINQVNFSALRAGIFFGQCSEICGANHSFMPIVMEMIKPLDFFKWWIYFK